MTGARRGWHPIIEIRVWGGATTSSVDYSDYRSFRGRWWASVAPPEPQVGRGRGRRAELNERRREEAGRLEDEDHRREEAERLEDEDHWKEEEDERRKTSRTIGVLQ
jgi:hypothetical protein